MNQSQQMAIENPKRSHTTEREEDVLLRAVRRIRSVLLGLVFGLVSGLIIFAATALLVLKGGDPVGPHLALLGQYFPGYTVTWGGGALGFLYGFATGFAAGWLVGWIYNTVLQFKRRHR